MRKIVKAILLVVAVAGLIPQFFYNQVFGGDYVPLSQHTFWNQLISPAWGTEVDLGWNSIPFLQYYFFSIFQSAISYILGGNLALVEKITWWGLFFALGYYSSAKLASLIVSKGRFVILSSIIFLFNTYSLSLLSGGQIAGIGLCYSLSPLVFYSFLMLLKEKTLSRSIGFSITLSLSVIFDVRITYIIVFGLGLVFVMYYLKKFRELSREEIKKTISYFFLVPLSILLLTHIYWLVPSFLYRDGAMSQLGNEYTSLQSLSFFSFAKLENSLTLLHPNWPENFFGKIYFMNPLFLILPAVLIVGLLLASKKDKEKISIFLGILLMGVFLAKGVNEPFGALYEFAFTYIPGFVLLRDPTKWYVLIAVAYSILLSFSVEKISMAVRKERLIGLGFLVFYLYFLLTPLITKNMNGTFIKSSITNDYQNFREALEKDTSFSRVLWFPSPHYSKISLADHPVLFPSSFLASSDPEVLSKYFTSKEFEKDIKSYSIGYIVVYEDREEKVFLKNPIYTFSQYSSLSAVLSKNKLLAKDDDYSEFSVFRVMDPSGKFSLNNGEISMLEKRPDYYRLHVSTDGPTTIIFSELYSPYWRAINQKTQDVIDSKIFGKINSFELGEAINSDFIIEFYPRHILKILIPFSFLMWLIVIKVYIKLNIQNKKGK